MSKYKSLIKAGFINTLAYRGPIGIWLIGNILSISVMAAIWLSVPEGQNIGGYNRQQLIGYYLVGLFIQYVTNWLPFYGITYDIAQGEINKWLTKPVSYFWSTFTLDVGWHLFSIPLGFIGSIILFVIFGYIVYVPPIINLLLVFSAIMMAIIIVFTFSFCLGATAFWFTEVSAIETLFWTGRMFLGGQGFPLSFFPERYKLIVEILPFRYMFSFPLELFFNQLNKQEIIKGFILEFIWILSLVYIYKIVWRKGFKKYGAFGG